MNRLGTLGASEEGNRQRQEAMTEALRSTVRLVAVLNLAYFGVEFAVALAIGSVSLFADSIDFLEDASVNFLIFAALGWTARNRARLLTPRDYRSHQQTLGLATWQEHRSKPEMVLALC